MKIIALLILLQIGSDWPVINATIDKSDDFYETSIDGYKKNEYWGNWAMPLSDRINSSSQKKSTKSISYNAKNLQDYNLNTACVFNNDSVSNRYFEFKFEFLQNTSYAGAYQFHGICNVFNGYCKSLKTWTENARVKTLLVYYNDKPICYVTLKDTWHFQDFDISKFFKNKRDKKYLAARYEIKNGDRLRFKIIDVYKGTKYTDVAISEFLCEGGTN